MQAPDSSVEHSQRMNRLHREGGSTVKGNQSPKEPRVKRQQRAGSQGHHGPIATRTTVQGHTRPEVYQRTRDNQTTGQQPQGHKRYPETNGTAPQSDKA